MTLRKIMLVACIATGFAAPMTPMVAAAQEVDATRVIIIDARRIFDESLAGKALNRWLEANRRRLSDRPESNPDIAAIVQKANSAAEEIAKQAQAGLINEEVGNQNLEAIRNTAKQELSNENVKIQKRIDAVNQANTEIENAVRPIVRQLMQERKANVVLEKGQIFDHLDGLDVTTQVIERLNKQMPALRVALPE